MPLASTAADVTPILLPVARSAAFVTPPVTSTCLLSFTLEVAPMSPLNLRPSFSVATSSVVPSGFSYTIRVVVVPAAPSTPGLPSRVIERFVVTPSLPLMPILPSLPFAPVAVTVSTSRFLFILTSIVVLPAVSCLMNVLIFLPL